MLYSYYYVWIEAGFYITPFFSASSSKSCHEIGQQNKQRQQIIDLHLT